MKALFLIFTIFFIIIGFASSIDLEITKKSLNEVMIYEFQNPVNFEIEIENLGNSDNFMIYNLVSFEISPEKFFIEENSKKNINFTITPLAKIESKGPFSFSYYIRGGDKSEIKKNFVFRIVKLEDAFDITSYDLDIDNDKLNVYLKNNINYNFENIKINFNSAFFNFSDEICLKPYEKKNFEIKLNKEDIDKLLAGFYTLDANLKIENFEVFLNSLIEFSEIDSLIKTKTKKGFVIKTEIIKQENRGNIIKNSTVSIQKNIFSRLFTSFVPEPDIVNREGFLIYYTWNFDINPGEELEIYVKTNWLIPFLVIVLIVFIIIFSKKYTQTDLTLRKKVSFVKTKGGEFALKVSILVDSVRYIEKVNIIDKLPPLVKVYEKFGSEIPSKVDEKVKRIEWNFEKLEAGEKRILNYIVYSKLGVLGRFALPSSTAIYEKEGKIKEVYSNRAFFVSEQKNDSKKD
jgi:hypothetical protein